jgi:apolipoprotein D and lipocalin family protein
MFFMKKLMLICLALLLGACSTVKLPPLQTQAEVDLPRFMGRWYVIANIPYRAEKNKVGTYVEYRPRPDGRMDDLYFFQKRDFRAPVQQWSGVAWVVDTKTNARWLAQFIWPFKFDYLILATAPDYSWALVGHPGRDLAWVFARTPKMDDTLYQQLLAKLDAQKYDSTRLRRVPQSADQLGLPGFQ